MSEAIQEQLRPPVILGPAGHIGRTTLQQLLEENIVPAGVILRSERLEDNGSRVRAAAEISRNFVADDRDLPPEPGSPDGERVVLHDVQLKNGSDPVLSISGIEIPVYLSDDDGKIDREAFRGGHPVIDATGAYVDTITDEAGVKRTSRELLEPILDAGAEFVLVTSPIKDDPTVHTIVYGVNDTPEKFAEALEDRRASTSSCTTTATSTPLKPFLEMDENGLAAIEVHVDHARTKSNERGGPKDVTNNIILASSGGAREIPRILGLELGYAPEFIFRCTRSNANCGSLANVNLTFEEGFGATDVDEARSFIEKTLAAGRGSYALDSIKQTKEVIGRRESAVINLDGISVHRVLGGITVAGIAVFYDNVAGYTRSMLDTYKRLAELSQERQAQ